MTAKKEWFVRCVDAVSRVTPNAAGYFLCPLCLLWCSDLADVTREHAPPESVGGHRVALTCVECNSTAGHQLDAHVPRLERVLDFAASTLTTPITGTFTIGDAAMAVAVTRTDDGVLLGGLPANTNPKQHAAVVEHLERLAKKGSWEGESLALSFRSRSTEAKVRTSWLRAAYLVAFAALGYRYILRSELEPVRAQLRDPDGEHTPRAVMFDPGRPADGRELWLVQRPKTMRGIFVAMGRWAVWLPGLGIDPTFYEKLAARKV